MDDESGWNEILLATWGPHVRRAVCERVERSFSRARGVLALTARDPDAAPAHATERVHAAVVTAIAEETGADLDGLGSQAAWATYDEVWLELGRRSDELDRFEPVSRDAVAEVRVLLGGLPPVVVEHAGAAVDERGRLVLVERDGDVVLDVEGLHRWLALDDQAGEWLRDTVRAVVRAARS